MKKLRLFLLLMVLVILFSACDRTEIIEPTQVPTTVPTEPAPDPVQIYEDAVRDVAASSQVSVHLDIEKRVHVDTQVFKESASYDLTYHNLNQNAFAARVTGDVKFGDAHEASVDENYHEGSVYGKVNDFPYVSQISQEDFLNRYVPAVLLDPAAYSSVAADKQTISFSNAIRLEDWIVRDGFELVEASGTAELNDQNQCSGFTYSVVYTYGSIRYEIDYRTAFTDEVVSPDKPSPYINWKELGVADTLLMFERAYGYMLLSDMNSLFPSQVVQSGVVNASFSRQNGLYMHRGEDVKYLEQAVIQVADYNKNEGYGLVTNALYNDGEFVFSEEGEQVERMKIEPEEAEAAHVRSLTYFFPEMIYTEDFYTSFVPGGIVFDFTFSKSMSEFLRQEAQASMFGEPQYLDLQASGYECLLAEGYLAIDQYSGLPTCNSITYDATHTIGGEKYPLTMQVTQIIDGVDRGAYTAITGEDLPIEGTVEEPTPLFYRVSGDDGEQMWLLGTIHLGDERTANLPNEIRDALTGSDALAVEFDLNDFSEQLMQDPELAETVLKEYLYLDGSMIQDHLQLEGLYEAAVQTMKMTGQLQGMILYTKPVIWNQLIEEFYLGQGYALSSDDGVDLQLLDWAEEQGKTILNVESGVDQLKMLYGLSDDVQEAMLASILSVDPASYNTAQMELYDLWCEGNEQKLIEQIRTDTSTMSQEELEIYEEYTKAVETDRNVQMLEVAEGYLESGETVFFAVGLAHLLAEDGLVNTLRAAGYTVELVSYS